jgi:hypothetical protein
MRPQVLRFFFWSKLTGRITNAPFDPDKAPPDPQETLDLFENQGYISKLIQWGLEASEPRRSRRHLVERQDDEPGES